MKFFNPEQYQKYNETLFCQYFSKIRTILPEARIEHIGASSIPHALSKGDLDIFVGVHAFELENTVKLLRKLNFQEKPETLRTSELCMLESIDGNDVAIQVVANGSEFEFFLTFRDRLRDNMLLIQCYNALKISCEGWAEDDYRKKKSAFIASVLRQSS